MDTASDQFTAIKLDLGVMVAQQQRRWRARLTTITPELDRAAQGRYFQGWIGGYRIGEDQ